MKTYAKSKWHWTYLKILLYLLKLMDKPWTWNLNMVLTYFMHAQDKIKQGMSSKKPLLYSPPTISGTFFQTEKKKNECKTQILWTSVSSQINITTYVLHWVFNSLSLCTNASFDCRVSHIKNNQNGLNIVCWPITFVFKVLMQKDKKQTQQTKLSEHSIAWRESKRSFSGRAQ